MGPPRSPRPWPIDTFPGDFSFPGDVRSHLEVGLEGRPSHCYCPVSRYQGQLLKARVGLRSRLGQRRAGPKSQEFAINIGQSAGVHLGSGVQKKDRAVTKAWNGDELPDTFENLHNHIQWAVCGKLTQNVGADSALGTTCTRHRSHRAGYYVISAHNSRCFVPALGTYRVKQRTLRGR